MNKNEDGDYNLDITVDQYSYWYIEIDGRYTLSTGNYSIYPGDTWSLSTYSDNGYFENGGNVTVHIPNDLRNFRYEINESTAAENPIVIDGDFSDWDNPFPAARYSFPHSGKYRRRHKLRSGP